MEVCEEELYFLLKRRRKNTIILIGKLPKANVNFGFLFPTFLLNRFFIIIVNTIQKLDLAYELCFFTFLPFVFHTESSMSFSVSFEVAEYEYTTQRY